MVDRDLTMPQGQRQSDGCPSWADKLLREIRAIEVQFGNIPEGEAWRTAENIRDLHERTFEVTDETAAEASRADQLFARVARELTREGFGVGDIVRFVNARVGYKGGPPYCNEAEVREVLSLGG